jgi:hypothetical protein
VNFRLLGGCLLLQLFENYRSSANIWTTFSPGANATIASYIATSNLMRFGKKISTNKKKASLPQRWRCSCKCKRRRIGSWVQLCVNFDKRSGSATFCHIFCHILEKEAVRPHFWQISHKLIMYRCFRQKKSAKNLPFLTQSTASLCTNNDHNIGLKEKRQIFAEKGGK